MYRVVRPATHVVKATSPSLRGVSYNTLNKKFSNSNNPYNNLIRPLINEQIRGFRLEIRRLDKDCNFKYDNLTIKTSTNLKNSDIDPEKLGFGNHFTDHMLLVDYKEGQGWSKPIIEPYGNFSMDPASMVLHYGLEIFEGLKAYKGVDGKVRLFRPELNMARMNKSAARLALPTFDSHEFRQCIEELVRLDAGWIPSGRGFSLYIRPTMIATHACLGVRPPLEARLYCILSPVGGFYKTSEVRLLAESNYARAWPGGAGEAKCGGNYAPTILPQKQAAEKKYDQVLWLFGDEHEITEVGTMNFFGLIINEQGQKELITAPLDGTILEGVTRRSVLDLANLEDGMKVSERKWTMEELEKALAENRVVELFGSGTAATVSPVTEISYKGRTLKIPTQDPTESFSHKVMNTIFDIQYGEIENHPWAPVILDETEKDTATN
eukprot:m.91196 g.91196  ORF g.91196 m.91196 type:complete len:437 (-) comp13291_c0_seq3:235-1545(-)